MNLCILRLLYLPPTNGVIKVMFSVVMPVCLFTGVGSSPYRAPTPVHLPVQGPAYPHAEGPKPAPSVFWLWTRLPPPDIPTLVQVGSLCFGISPWGCLPRGVSAWGCLLGVCLLRGDVCQAPLWTE